MQDCFRQAESVNAPAPLRRHFGRSLIEKFIFGFEKAVVNLVKQFAKNLWWCFDAVRQGVSAEKDPVLIFVIELACRAQLASECADGYPDFYSAKALKFLPKLARNSQRKGSK